MISTGEVGGILEQALTSLANQLQKQKALNDNIKSAISYPKNIGIFALVLLHAMLAFMVPIFKNMIPESTELNGLTQFIFNASDFLRSRWYIWFGTIAAFVTAVYFIAKSPPMHKLWEQHKLHAPLIGELMTKQTIARFCRTLATLLAGGVTAVEALKSAGPTSGSDLIAKAVEDAISDIEEGKSISDSLDKSGLFPPMVTGMIAIGEEAGTLPELLDKVAEFYEEDVETLSRNLKAMIEPIALIGIGGIVGAMIIALYLPIFTASTNVEGY
jgi:type IV pilus assembly protein PilC